MNDLMDAIGKRIESRSDLARQAVTVDSPVVESLIREPMPDVRRIEHALDGLLDFCFDPEALRLFRQLCRRYDEIDPAATADDVRFYREMYDSEREVES